MTSITFPRPTRALLNLNDRHHWARKAADVRAWRTAAFGAAVHHNLTVQTWPKSPAMVVVTVDVPDNRRRDPANIWVQKPIVDALVEAGWWPDDTPEWVTVVEPVLRIVPKGAPLMVQVELKPR